MSGPRSETLRSVLAEVAWKPQHKPRLELAMKRQGLAGAECALLSLREMGLVSGGGFNQPWTITRAGRGLIRQYRIEAITRASE